MFKKTRCFVNPDRFIILKTDFFSSLRNACYAGYVFIQEPLGCSSKWFMRQNRVTTSKNTTPFLMFMADWSVINHVTDTRHRKILEAKNNPFHWRMPYSAS